MTQPAQITRARARVSVSFFVPGQPVAKARARYATHGGFVRAYTPAKTAAYEGLVQLCCGEAMKGDKPISGAVALDLVIGVQIPTSWSKKRQQMAVRGEIGPTKKPDIDNVVKALCDGMNGIAYADDAQIVSLTTRKHYTFTPGVCVSVRTLDMEAA